MAQAKEAPKRIFSLYIKAELVKEDCNVVDLCEACERVTGHGSIDGATLVNCLWRVLPFNEVTRAKLLINGIKMYGKQLMFEGKNPFLHPSGEGETQTTKLIIKNLPFSYDQSAVERNLINAGFKLRGKMQWMKGRKRSTGHLSDFRDGRRSVFVDLPTWEVNPFMRMGAFRAKIEYAEMKKVCYRCLQDGHTARDCTNEEVCRTCRKPGHRKDQCPSIRKKDDHDCDSDSDMEGPESVPANGEVFSEAKQNNEGPPVGEACASKNPGEVNDSKENESKKKDRDIGRPSQGEQEKDYRESDQDAKSKQSNVSNEVSSPETISNIEVGSIEEIVVIHKQPCLTPEGDSPLSDFIKNVQFADLPVGSSKLLDAAKMPKHSKNGNNVSASSEQVHVGTPVSRGLQNTGEYKKTEKNENSLSSVWGDNLESECLDDDLLMAANMAENEESSSTATKENNPTKGLEVISASNGKSDDCGNKDKRENANPETAEDLAGASVPNFVSAGKRLFNAIVSPTEGKKKPQRGPKSKKK